MIHPSEIKIEDYQYNLPEERIARFPLSERDSSKLLIFREGTVSEDVFKNLSEHIPVNTLLLFNQAKVIHARLHFRKLTGALLELFCLEPDTRYPDITTAMMQEREVYWKCLIKGAAKWKDDSEVFLETDDDGVEARAKKVVQEGNTFVIHFQFKSKNKEHFSFSEFLEHAGKMPIPPYLKREADKADETRYQTIFAKEEGSVAAPTASLHFTEQVLQSLKKKNIQNERLTLHVGAGTFMPVKSETMKGHEMHSEWIEVSLQTIQRIIEQLKSGNKIIPVGTTSARTLESIYWIGVQQLEGVLTEDKIHDIAVSQWYPYEKEYGYSSMTALTAIIAYLQNKKSDKLITRTQLIIAPGYQFRLTDALITNFHQPSSTLLLMIAALIGTDWHNVYDYALNNNFRFLSYGDSSLLWKA